MARCYSVISGDSHLEVAPSVWNQRVPAAHRAKIPTRLDPNSSACPMELRTTALLDADEVRVTNDAASRLRLQDADGVDAEILFPSAALSALTPAGVGDNDAYLAIVRAYNEFLATDFCAAAPDRLVGIGLIPLTGVADATAELERCHKLGLRGCLLRKWPNGSNKHVAEDDRFFAAAVDLDMKICLQEGVVGELVVGGEQGINRRVDPATGRVVPAPPEATLGTLGIGVSSIARISFGSGGVPALTLAQFIGTGLLDRFPRLRFYFTEAQASWVAHYLVMSDERHQRIYPYADYRLKKMPSQYIRDHCRFCFVVDDPVIAMRYDIGLDLLMWGSHSPYPTGTGLRSAEYLDQIFDRVPAQERRQILVDNPCDYFGLNPQAALTPTAGA